MDMRESVKSIWDNSKVFKTKFNSFDAFYEWMTTVDAMRVELGESNDEFSGPLHNGVTPYEVANQEGVLIVEIHFSV